MINPGIQRTVSFLNAEGFETCDSGDGSTHDFGCDRPYGYVVVTTTPNRLMDYTDQLVRLFTEQGLRVVGMPETTTPEADDEITIQAVYDPGSGMCIIDIIGITDKKVFK